MAGPSPSMGEQHIASIRAPITGPLSRRSFLRGSVGAGSGLLLAPTMAALLAACSSEQTAPASPTVVPLFSPDRVLVAGRAQRIPFAIVTPDPALDPAEVAMPADDASVQVTISRDGAVVAESAVRGRIVNHDHVGEPDPDHQHANLFRYYPLRATLDEPGIYDLEIRFQETRSELVIQLFDQTEAELPLPGDPFPAVAGPTFDDPAGVDRICTRIEPCPFHDDQLADLVGGGTPLAVLVATPAFCSTAYCGPVLETLIEESGAHPGVRFVHLEVYANPDEVDGNFLDPRIRLAPAVEALGLGFEPSLFLVSGDGTVVDRIDNVFDRTELAEVLSALR